MKTEIAAGNRIKHGTVRDDGCMFWAYQNGGEYWVTPDTFSSLTKRALVNKKKRYYEDIEKARALSRKYSRRSLKRQIAYNRIYREKNRESVREWRREYVKKNREKINEQRRALSSKNKDKKREQRKKYALKYPERVRAQKAVRRAMKRKACVNLSQYEKRVIAGFYADSARLSKSWGIPWHVDHIVPISKGGKHHPSNLQLLPAIANLKKGAKIAA